MELINPRHLRYDNYVLRNGEPCRIYMVEFKYKSIWVINDLKVDERTINDLFETLLLTKEILRDNLGFSIHDMGDFWQCEKEDFILIQPKIQLGIIEMPYIFVLKSSINGSVTFKYVHHLQNTYLDLKGELLQWKQLNETL